MWRMFQNLLLRIIVGTRDAETKKKLSVISLFPYFQVAVNMFRSDKSALSNERTLSGISGVAAFNPTNDKFDDRSRNKCGCSAHLNVISYPAAEVNVSSRNFMAALGLSEKDLAASLFDLVMAERSFLFLSIGQLYIHIRYRGRSGHDSIVFCPEI
jgi:hypothetical protein